MELLAKIFRMLSGTLQWYVLWFAHAKFILGISGVILNEEGKVLLLRHRFWKKDSWGLPSGYAVRGEALPVALVREVKEETGLDVSVLGLIRIVSGYRLRVEASFLGKLDGGTLRIDGKEILEASFFPVTALPVGLLDSHRKLIELASGFSGSPVLETPQ